MNATSGRKLLGMLVALVMIMSLIAGCSSTPAESSASTETSTEATTEASEESSTEASEESSEEASAEESAAESENSEAEAPAGDDQLPREETLYFNGQQWGSINDWNPLSGNSNNAMALAATPYSRILIYETLMMWDPMTMEFHPLLATGYEWNDTNTEMTVHLNPDAHWYDGTPFTADDVAYTWEAAKKYNAATAFGTFDGFIDTIEAVDDNTVVIKATVDSEGKPVNSGYAEIYLGQSYQMQKAYLQKIEQENGEDPEKVTTARMEDLQATGPYKPYIDNDQKVVFIRDENYWGQAESMWGELPVPKYIAHTIYKDNAAGDTAFRQGEVDVSQQFMSNVQDLWEKDGLDVSTWLVDAPYQLAMITPTAFFNCKKPGLDRVEVRKAISMAVDYNQIISSAMSGQSPTFEEYPRCIAPPVDAVRDQYIDTAQLTDLQFGGDVAGANQLLDSAGIVDTDGDGIREVDGSNLSFRAEVPSGWSDWNASMEIIAAAGKEIGINIETYFPEASVFYTDMTTHSFDIIMWSPPGVSALTPYQQAMFCLSKQYGDLPVDWNGNFGQYENEEVEQILAAITQTTDDAQLKEYYTRLSAIMLEDVPCFALMYRPAMFYTVNESVWTNFPAADDGRGIPPLDCTDGYGIAALYELELA